MPFFWISASVAGEGPNEVCSRNLALVNETAAGGGGVRFTVALAVELALATAVARMLTAGEDGMVVGAV